MTDEDYEFNRIERESLMRMQAVKAAVPKESSAQEVQLRLEVEELMQECTLLRARNERLEAEKAADKQAQQEPVALKVDRGELCYKSQEDDQSFGMWCPITPNSDLPFSDGTKFYTAPPTLSPAQRQPFAWANTDDLSADTAFRWCEIGDHKTPIYTYPTAQRKPLTDDPLQGAVDWLLEADGEYFCTATVQRTLRIGYNRAKRLCDTAKERADQGIKGGT